MRQHSLLVSPALLLCLGLLPACFNADDGMTMLDDDGADESGDDGVDDGAADGAADGADGADGADDGAADGADGADDGSADGADGGSDDGADGGTDGGTDTGEPADDEPPVVLETEPVDGATGVYEDQTIVITFSEPMDKVATQAAYQSADLPASAVTMSWNAAGDTLTVTPNDPLEYAVGWDTTVEALSFSVSLNTTARDVAGNELEDAVDLSFTTQRRIGVVLSAAYLYTGTSSADSGIIGSVWVGDGINGESYLGAASFVLDGLPEGIAEFEAASVSLYQNQLNGAPYELGNIEIGDAEFEGIAAAWDAEVTPIGMLSDDDALGWRDIDVAAEVMADYEVGALMTQFVLSFDDESNFDGTEDRVRFEGAGVLAQHPPVIEGIYLIP